MDIIWKAAFKILPKGICLADRQRRAEAGQYFVAEGAGDYVLDTLCKTLRLRGVIAPSSIIPLGDKLIMVAWVQFHGSSSSIRLMGCPLPIRSRASANQACGFTSLSLAVSSRE
jgi:hypothetical protein